MDKLSWVSHPAKIRKRAAIMVLIFIMLVFAVVYSVTGSPFMVALAAIIFVATLSTFFFPTGYEITREKVKVKYLFNKIEKEIKNFRSFYPDKNGVLLSPFAKPSRLENFRGVYIRYHQNKNEVDAFIKKIFEEQKVEP